MPPLTRLAPLHQSPRHHPGPPGSTSHDIPGCRHHSSNQRHLFFSLEQKIRGSEKSRCLPDPNPAGAPRAGLLSPPQPGWLCQDPLEGSLAPKLLTWQQHQQAGVQAGPAHRREQIEKGFGKSPAQMLTQKGDSSLCSIFLPLPASQGVRVRNLRWIRPVHLSLGKF